MNLLSHQLTKDREQCDKLRRLLEEEFESLRGQNLEAFESLQPLKTAILADLGQAVDRHRLQLSQANVEPEVLATWEAFRAAMLECRDLHRRNELLILRKRDAIEGALLALVGGLEPTSGVDVYDRLGRINRANRKSAYAQA